MKSYLQNCSVNEKAFTGLCFLCSLLGGGKKCKTFSGNGTGRPSKYENQISWGKLHFIMRIFLEIEP